MSIAIILVIAAVLSLLVIVRMAVVRNRQLSTVCAGIQPLDIDAFRNLIDPREDEYLRTRVSPRDFRHVQRKRLRAAAAYIQVAGKNAAFLVRIGQIALASPEPDKVKAAQRLIDEALLLRRNAMVALVRIRIASVWPSGQVQGGAILERYRSVDRSAMLLARLQNPAATVRVSAS